MRAPAAVAVLLVAGPALSRPSARDEAVAVARALTKRDYAAVAARFDARMKAALPVEKLRATWDPVAARSGKLGRVGEPRAFAADGFDGFVVPLVYEHAAWDVKVVFGRDAKITGLFFVPGQRDDWRPPDYAATTVAAIPVKVGSRALPGTLTLPWGNGPYPAVVLVHGSGPHDGDETIGPNRPFADLALGLAAAGVATLRYEKRTHAHPGEFAVERGYTIEDETVADAVAAVELAASAPAVDPRRVFLAGHSLGGFLAPRIAARSPKVAGVVVLAGSTRRLEDIVVDQTRYLAGQGSAAAARAEAFAAVVRDPKLGAADKVDMMGIALPGAYFLDLRRYDAPAVAATLKVPILVLQGERDFQVTRADYDGWVKALSGRAGVKLKLYPGLNHLFEAGEGASTPAEYDRPGLHVAPEVVSDVAAFASATRK